MSLYAQIITRVNNLHYLSILNFVITNFSGVRLEILDILTVPLAKRVLPNCFFGTVKSPGTRIKPVEFHMKEDNQEDPRKGGGRAVGETKLAYRLDIDGHRRGE